MHGLSPFSNKFATIKFLQHFVTKVQNLQNLMVIIKKEVLNFLSYFHFETFLCCITVNV